MPRRLLQCLVQPVCHQPDSVSEQLDAHNSGLVAAVNRRPLPRPPWFLLVVADLGQHILPVESGRFIFEPCYLHVHIVLVPLPGSDDIGPGIIDLAVDSSPDSHRDVFFLRLARNRDLPRCPDDLVVPVDHRSGHKQ